jgi:hypothetical protein
MMTPHMAMRLRSLALLMGSGLLLLSVSACHIVPEPVPGQPLTAEQAAYAKLVAQQEANERRRQDRCSPPGCHH